MAARQCTDAPERRQRQRRSIRSASQRTPLDQFYHTQLPPASLASCMEITAPPHKPIVTLLSIGRRVQADGGKCARNIPRIIWSSSAPPDRSGGAPPLALLAAESASGVLICTTAASSCCCNTMPEKKITRFENKGTDRTDSSATLKALSTGWRGPLQKIYLQEEWRWGGGWWGVCAGTFTFAHVTCCAWGTTGRGARGRVCIARRQAHGVRCVPGVRALRPAFPRTQARRAR